MPAFRRLEIASDVLCNGGVRLAVLPDSVRIDPTYDLSGDETLIVSLPSSSPAYASLQEKRVARLVRRNNAGTQIPEEWRIAEREDVSGSLGQLATFTARPLLLDLASAIISSTNSDGTMTYAFGFVDLTLAQVWDTYCVPALASVGLSYWDRGTFDMSIVIPEYSFERQSVLSLMKTLAEKYKYETRGRMNGTSGYLFDVLTAIGAGSAKPRVQTRKNLDSLRRTRSTSEQATLVVPIGADTGDGSRSGIESVRWMVTAVNGGTGRVTIADELGVFSAIKEDDQLNGWRVFRDLTGRSIAITDTFAATQELALADLSSIAVGELLYLRESDTDTNYLPYRGWVTPGGVMPLYYVSAINGGTLRLTIKDSPGGASIGFAANDDLADWQANTFTFVYQWLAGINTIQAVSVPNQSITLNNAANLSGVLPGDLVIVDASTNTAPHYGGNPPHYPVALVVSANNTTKEVVLSNYYEPGAIVVNGAFPGAQAVRFFRPSVTRLVRASFLATDEVSMTTVASISVGDLIEFQQISGGVLPTKLSARASQSTYGIVKRFVDRDTLHGETNLVRNSFQRTWTGISTVPPDGWSLVGGATVVRSTDPQFTKYGGKSALVTFNANAGLQTFPFRVWRVGRTGRTRVSVRFRITFDLFGPDSQLMLLVGNTHAYSLFTPAYASGISGTILPSPANTYVPGVTYDIIVTNVDVSAEAVRSRLTAQLVGGAIVGSARAYVDVLQVTQTSYDPGAYIEASGGCELWAEGNRYLTDFEQPVTEYAGTLRDLERIDGTAWPDDAIVLGGQIDLRDTDLNVTVTPRVVRYSPNELDPLSSQVTLSTRQKPLTRLLTGN